MCHLVYYMLEDFSTTDEPMCLVIVAQKLDVLGPLRLKVLCSLNSYMNFD